MDAETMSLVRALATQIGIILEDAATTALLLAEEDQLSPKERFHHLQLAGADVMRIAEATLAILRRAEADTSLKTSASRP
jgi:hypothetical protein